MRYRDLMNLALASIAARAVAQDIQETTVEPSAVLTAVPQLVPSATFNAAQASNLVEDIYEFISTVSQGEPLPQSIMTAVDALATESADQVLLWELQKSVNLAVFTAPPGAVASMAASALAGKPYSSVAMAQVGYQISVATPLVNELRTLIASDLGRSEVPLPTATAGPSTSPATTASRGVAPRPTGNMAAASGAVAVAVGVVGLALM